LPHNTVNSVVIEGNGTLWIGTDDGLASLNGENWTLYNTSNSDLPDNDINTIVIYESENKIIGTNGGGLASFIGENWTVYNSSNSSLPSNTVQAIALEANSNVWIGTTSGIALYSQGAVVSVEDSKESEDQFPNRFVLHQNYPNPFNPSTIINYQIPEEGFVNLKVYNTIVEEVKELVNEYKSLGTYSIHFDAAGLASGVYIYQIRVNNFVSSRKMIIVK
jgi:hypothetical protein